MKNLLKLPNSEYCPIPNTAQFRILPNSEYYQFAVLERIHFVLVFIEFVIFMVVEFLKRTAVVNSQKN